MGRGLGTTLGATVFVCRWRLSWQGGLGTTHGAAVFVCRWGLLWRGALEQHTGPQSLFAGGCCCGGGPWNNTRGRSLCLQVGGVVGGGLGTTHGAAVFVCRWGLLWRGALEQHTGPQSLFAGGCCCGGGPWNNTRGRSLCLQVGGVVGGGLGTTHGAAVFVGRSSTK